MSNWPKDELLRIAEAGAKLVLGARRIDRRQVLARKLSLGKDAAVKTDVTMDRAQVQALVDRAVRALSEGLRQEVKPYNIRTTVICPGAVATELPNSITDPDTAAQVRKFTEEVAIAADSFARAVAFAISQPEDVDINEILFRPTRQEL
ncbi:MAG: SDR family oxidoreductase [Gemmataceae bacterium]